MKTLIIAALIAGIATPAFAQSFDPDNGTGNLVWRHAPAPQNDKVLPGRGQTGDNAFAAAPRMGSGNEQLKSGEVDRTGGGSIGYNENLKQY